MAQEAVFDVLPVRRRAKLVQAVIYAVFGLAALALALVGPWGWIGWLLGGALLGLAIGKAIAVVRMRYVAKVDDAGVTVCLPTGREMTARWGEIQAHTIDPEKALGGIIVGAARSRRVRILPVATRDMGPEAAAQLLAIMKKRLPKLEFRVPTVGRG